MCNEQSKERQETESQELAKSLKKQQRNIKSTMHSDGHRGPDGTYPRVLKELAEKLLGPLSIIFKCSWRAEEALVTGRGKTSRFFSKRGITDQLTWHPLQVKLGL